MSDNSWGGKRMDIPTWAYIVVGVLGVIGLISLMWFSYFLDKSEKKK